MSQQKIPNVYECRAAGRKACQTEGSDHYKSNGVEPIDLAVSQGYLEGFALGSIQKYAGRFGRTQNLKDLVKLIDYAQILLGYKVLQVMEEPGVLTHASK